ncbi:phenoloxidase-activating factor 2-like [Epargyreus clarus]|uniref:phenoloxidase-activating factor 2-like n=1 Tax=Epargyreus clarus TaxID=520877 RepID=UPI003C2C3242
MRVVLLLISVGLLGANAATIDQETALFVLSAVCINNTDDSTGNSEFPPCETKKLDLTPTKVESIVECTTRDNHPGVCVLYYQCDTKTKTIIDDGATILDIRSTECSHYLEVCCRRQDLATTSEVATTTPSDEPNLAPDRHNDQPSDPVTTQRPTKNTSPVKKTVPQCGWSNPGVNIFKLRSKDDEGKSPYADYGDFPFMVAILKKSEAGDVWTQGDYLGGGTLIHPSVVMTVAHKFTVKKKLEPDQLKCRAGEWDTQTTLELFPHQERDVAKYITHEEFYRTSLYNDIALLFLAKPFTLNGAPHMGTACLGTELPPDTYNCYSMGWGSEFKQKKKYAVILKKVPLQIVSRDRCQKMLRDNSRLGQFFKLHDSFTCANGADGVDTCRGDGGSPLVCPVSTKPGELRYMVYGMVAYGIACGNPLIPGVYANIPYLKKWVDEKMQQENFGSEYYTM